MHKPILQQLIIDPLINFKPIQRLIMPILPIAHKATNSLHNLLDLSLEQQCISIVIGFHEGAESL